MTTLPSFESLASDTSVEGLLKEHQKYFAHTPNELLANHMALVSDYFLKIIQGHNLETVMDRLFLRISDENTRSAEVIKKLFWDTVLYHDFGKVNGNFQRVKMKNPLFPSETKNGIKTQHSILSAYIFLIHQYSNAELERIADSDQRLYTLTACFAHNILRHHSARLDDLSDKKTFQKFTNELCASLIDYLSLFNKEGNRELITLLPNLPTLLSVNLSSECFLLIRLNFSLLTAADYYATSHYCEKWQAHYKEFGTLTVEQKERLYQNLKSSLPHNKNLYEQVDSIQNLDLTDLSAKSSDNLNKLRAKMATEVLQNIRKYSNEKLFYIEAPTGSGKTNLAFIATQELLQANSELKKVYYVFPFTTLITQTKRSAQETLLLKPDEFVELHSKAPLKEKEQSEEEQDGLYGESRLDDIHNQFVNYPYIFLSHIRFFDILKANDKSSIYLLHSLANSIIVIDEVQAYNPMLWDKMAFLLKTYAELLNIRFVVMSATLPKIGDLVEASFRYLLPDAITRFFTNANFADRVKFDDTLTKLRVQKAERNEYIQKLATEIHSKCEAYKIENRTVRVIVEFIFKRSATEFAEIAKEIFSGYQILVLSGTILESRRKEIIYYLKNADSLTKDILLITTQVVEAGVDIDMDLGFKNRSIIDSEEQLAGRVNRNAKKNNCTVYLFDLDDASVIYGGDRRYREWKKGLDVDYLTILQTKRFDIIYDRIKSFLKETNEGKNIGGTLSSFKRKLENLNFPDVDKEFQLIEQESISVFVPINLPIYVKNGVTRDPLFTESQIRFLIEQGIAIEDDQLSGELIFNLYKRIITNRELIFSDRRGEIQSIQSVMSLFTFSLFSKSQLMRELEGGGNPVEYGYLYLTTYNEVYDYELGLLDHKFSNMIFL